MDEYTLIKKLNIDYEYFNIERRFLGNGKTRVKDTDSNAEKIGITYKKILPSK